MANNSPTIVAASLSDDQLKKSIDSLVTHVDEAMKKMVQSTNNAVGEMEAKLKSLGNVRIDTGSTSDGGASKRAKAQNAETDAVEKNITVRDRQIKKNQEVAMSFDQMANAQQKATSGGKFLNFNEAELDRMKAKLRELEAEYVKINREGGGLATESRSNALRSQIQAIYSDITLYENALKNLANVQKHQADTSKKNVRLNDEYPKLIEWYKQLEQEDQKRIKRLEKMIELSRKAEEAQRKAIEAANKRAFGDNLSGALSMSERSIDQMLAKVRRLQSFLDTNKLSGFTLLSESQVNRINNSIDKINDKLAKQEQQRVDAIRKQQEAEERASQKRLADLERERVAQDKAVSSYQDKALKSAWRDALRMPTENIDQATAKIERIKSLISTLHPIGIISKVDVDVANATILKLEKRFDIQTAVNKETKEGIKFENQSRDAINALNTAISQNTSRETERQRAMIESGVAAQNAFAKIRQSVQDQLAVNTDKPIQGIQELTEAIKNMNRLYWGVSVEGRESPLAQALKRDIDNAIELRKNIEAFNRNLAGVSFRGAKDGAGAASTLGSYTELSNILKSLTDEYRKLGREERNAAKGDELANKIQNLSRATQKMQQQMSRPISFSAAMKGDEKTLDDIAYKMQRLRSYRQGIDLTKPNAANEIKQVDDALAKLQKDADKWMAKSKDMIASNNALGRSWNYMKNRLAFYFTVGASTQFIKNLIEVRSQYEMNERALGILINSAERGTQIFNELSQMALVSPYTLIELSSAAKQLTAYDIAARDVVDTTRRLADMASAVGVPIERLTYALGQIKAYGYLNSRDARMFANAGIPLVKQLSDYYTELEGKMVSTADVYDRMKKKAIDYNSVMAVVTKMTDEGGKFFDFQAKMADTLKVRLANLTLAWNNMLNDMGKETQGVLTWSIGALRDLFLQWKNLYGALNEVALVFGVAKALQFLGVCAHAAGIGFGSLNKYMTLNSLLGTRLAATVRTLGNALWTLVHSPLAWFAMAALLVTEIGDAFINADRATKEFNNSLREGAKTTYEDLKKFAEQYKNVRDSLYTTQKTAIGNIYDPSTGKAAATAYANQTVGQDISASEAKKVWEAMREQIELSSHASDEYISKLLSIENVSERLRQGFQILDDIQTVSAALKEIGEDGIKVTQSWAAWWNAWQGADGLIGNVKDLQKEIQRLQDAGQDPNDKFTKVIDKDYATALERFRKDLKVTTDSVLNFINLNGWSGDTGKIDEVFKQVTDKLATQGNLDPQTAFTLQKDVEIARAKAAKEALEIRIADEKNALATASDEISKQQIQKNLETLEQQKRDFDKFNGENRAYWNDFTKYIKERHISELTAAYNSMTDHGKKAMDFQSEEWQKRVHDWANRYEKSHNLATDSVFKRLRNWINDANTWSVFIKMTISTEDGKSVYKQLEEYDKAADDAWKTMQRLDKRISQLRKKGAKEVEGAETGAIDLSRVSQDDRELTEALKERTQAQKDYNDAVEKGGESKKESSAASKAQKAAESELQKALKDELQLIDRVRSQYKKLTDAGANSGEALAYVTNQFVNSLARINSILGKNGIPLFDISKFAGTDNPQALLDMLKLQLDSAKVAKNIKPEEIKELEVKYSEIVVDAKAYNLTKITKGLNNELDRLKEEYELAVALDADPELGSIFANYMGINLEDLPKTAEEAAKKAQEYIDKILAENNSSEKIDISSLMDKKAFDSWVESSGHSLEDELVKRVSAFRSYLHKVNVDETKNQAQEWNKLLEKYAEYEYKVTQIQKEAEREREIARKKGASQDVFDAINNRERQEIARVGFEKFQKSPEWIAATGDLANMSKSAIGMLIEELERYKRTAKNLSPKEIKQLNNALSKLYKEQRKNNPFKAVVNMLDEAKERMSIFDEEIEETQKQIDELSKKHKTNLIDGIADDDTQKKLKEAKERLGKLKEERDNIGKIDASTWVSSINETISAVKSAIEVFDGLAKAIGGVENSDVDKVFSILDSAGKGASTGAAFGGYGAIIGGVVGAAAGVVNAFADVWSGNESINKSIEVSTQKVRTLEREYKRLERAVDDAYGTDAIGAQRLMMLNKEAELAELERQLELEKSRKAKNKDQEKIDELRDKVDELRYEVNNAAREIVLDLLEIGDAQDWANDFVKGMIDAFREGENYMKSYEDAFREMVDNMIAKTIAGKVIGERIEQMLEFIKNTANARAEGDASVIAARDALDKLEEQRERFYRFREGGEDVPEEVFDQINKDIADAQDRYAEVYAKAAVPTPEDIENVRDRVSSWKDDVKNEFDAYMEAFGVGFGSAKDSQQLSALQQGIQSVSETTASALEGYMNGVSQQVYYQSDILTQIRDILIGGDGDVQLGVQAQMLLQLQQSYQVQMSIQGILEGVLTPSGQGFRVELLS